MNDKTRNLEDERGWKQEVLEIDGINPDDIRNRTEEAAVTFESGKELGAPISDWEAIVEAVLFTMGQSVEVGQLAAALEQDENMARAVVQSLQQRYQAENRGMQIIELENAYQMCTRAEFYEHLIRVAATPKKQVLTEVVLETLSIIAYKQPVTKAEIGKIRGVTSDHAVNRLVEYGLVYEVGRLDAPGRPALFATTEEFLRRFGVGNLTDLPSLKPEQAEEIKAEVEEELQWKEDALPQQPGDGEPAESKPADSQPAESELADCEPADGGTADHEPDPAVTEAAAAYSES